MAKTIKLEYSESTAEAYVSCDNGGGGGEIPLGLRLTWDSLANSQFADHTALNNFIAANVGSANYTSMVIDGNTQIFLGGSNVNTGDNFFLQNNNITGIEDQLNTIVSQGDACQALCANLQFVRLNGLVNQGNACQTLCPLLSDVKLNNLETQKDDCQDQNAILPFVNLPKLITQGGACQSTSPNCQYIDLPLLTAQGNSCQRDNIIMTSVNVPLCTNFGTTTGDDYIGMGSNEASCTWTVPISLQTADAGNPDGDLVRLAAAFATINYV